MAIRSEFWRLLRPGAQPMHDNEIELSTNIRIAIARSYGGPPFPCNWRPHMFDRFICLTTPPTPHSPIAISTNSFGRYLNCYFTVKIILILQFYGSYYYSVNAMFNQPSPNSVSEFKLCSLCNQVCWFWVWWAGVPSRVKYTYTSSIDWIDQTGSSKTSLHFYWCGKVLEG